MRILAAMLVLASAVAPALADKDAQPKDASEVLLSRPKPVPAFALTGHDGKRFGAERFKGRWTFVFFGFTHCPDVCPAVLQHLAMTRQTIASRHPAAPMPTALFISVDVQRDTPAQLAEYVAAFDKAFAGATGSEDEIRNVERIFSANHRIRPKAKPGEYMVAHSSEIYLVDPEGRHVATFWPPIDAEVWAKLYADIVARAAKPPAR
jgi:protein SCO1/2